MKFRNYNPQAEALQENKLPPAKPESSMHKCVYVDIVILLWWDLALPFFHPLYISISDVRGRGLGGVTLKGNPMRYGGV